MQLHALRTRISTSARLPDRPKAKGSELPHIFLNFLVCPKDIPPHLSRSRRVPTSAIATPPSTTRRRGVYPRPRRRDRFRVLLSTQSSRRANCSNYGIRQGPARLCGGGRRDVGKDRARIQAERRERETQSPPRCTTEQEQQEAERVDVSGRAEHQCRTTSRGHE